MINRFEWLRNIRESRKLKRSVAARGAKITEPSLCLIENGKVLRPGADIILKLAKFYGLSIDYLYNKFDLDHIEENENKNVGSRRIDGLTKEEESLLLCFLKVIRDKNILSNVKVVF